MKPIKDSLIFENPTETFSIQNNLPLMMKENNSPTREICQLNHYYSYDLVIKLLLDYDDNKTLHFGIPHGVTFITNPGHGAAIPRPGVATFLYHNEIGAQEARAVYFSGRLIKAEHPFLILIKVLKEQNYFEKLTKRNYNLFIPGHQVGESDVAEGLQIEEIELLKSKFSRKEMPFVLMRIEDIKKNRDAIYRREGFRIFTAGSIFDPKFLMRWINIVMCAENIYTSTLGSHLFYSLSLGKNIKCLRQLNSFVDFKTEGGGSRRIRVEDASTLKLISKLNSRENNKDLSLLARTILGQVENLLEPEVWKDLEEESKKFHKYLPLVNSLSKLRSLQSEFRR